MTTENSEYWERKDMKANRTFCHFNHHLKYDHKWSIESGKNWGSTKRKFHNKYYMRCSPHGFTKISIPKFWISTNSLMDPSEFLSSCLFLFSHRNNLMIQAESFYYVNYGSSIITSKVSQIISVVKTKHSYMIKRGVQKLK